MMKIVVVVVVIVKGRGGGRVKGRKGERFKHIFLTYPTNRSFWVNMGTPLAWGCGLCGKAPA
jgi:hypothetical protein